MSWNPENHADYAFSEYSQPSERNEINYVDPRYYQTPPESGETPHSLPQPVSAYAYQQATMGEYRGPASLDYYTADAGAAQRGAVSNGYMAAPAKAPKKRLADLGGLGVALGLILKFGLFGGSALLSVIVYAGLFGWEFGVGLVVLLFVHEMGHAVVMKLKGIPIGGMVFIPMLGAAVFMNRMPQNARGEAEVGIAGPIAGALASLVCLLVALASPFAPGVWAALAYFGFLMNLFNLIPMVPLDGGRISAAIDRRMWIVGLVMLVAVYIWEWINGTNSIFLLIVIVLSVIQFWSRRQTATNTPEAQAYYAVPLHERIIIALAYFGLAAALAFGMSVAHGLMNLP
ncbi:MAG: site-2 protease family protein [Ktedonobacteraceae bacterium]